MIGWINDGVLFWWGKDAIFTDYTVSVNCHSLLNAKSFINHVEHDLIYERILTTVQISVITGRISDTF